MRMENHKLMQKISRIFPSSFSSCHLRTLPDVAESSINKTSKENNGSRRRRSSLSLPPNKTLPLSPKTHRRRSSAAWFSSSDVDLDTTDTFFSLSSNSGDSFRLRPAAPAFKHMKSIDEAAAPPKPAPSALSAAVRKPSMTAAEVARQEPGSDLVATQVYYGDGGEGCRRRRRRRRRRVRRGESMAVEKSSSDPRGDFRASMVEMIVEKQIFAAADLERLLRCFLALNAAAYHGVILDVFTEICQTLFSN